MGICSSCGGTTSPCEKCNIPICKKCGQFAHECPKQPIFQVNSVGHCEICSKLSISIRPCISCKMSVCNFCLSNCACCQSRLCQKCVKLINCSHCLENFCKNCILECQKCQHFICRNCLQNNNVKCPEKYCNLLHKEKIEFGCVNCTEFICADCVFKHEVHLEKVFSLEEELSKKLLEQKQVLKKAELILLKNKEKYSLDLIKAESIRKIDILFDKLFLELNEQKAEILRQINEIKPSENNLENFLMKSKEFMSELEKFADSRNYVEFFKKIKEKPIEKFNAELEIACKKDKEKICKIEILLLAEKLPTFVKLKIF